MNIIVDLIKKKQEVDSVMGAIHYTIGVLLNKCLKWPDLKRDMLINYFPNFLQYLLRCLDMQTSSTKSALTVVSWSLEMVPQSLRTHHPKIKEICEKLMDCPDPDIRMESCVCLTLLPNTELMWTELMDKLLREIQTYLNYAFYGIESTETENDISIDEKPTPTLLIEKIKSRVDCLELLLSNNYEFTSNVPVENFFVVLLRIFNNDGSKIITNKPKSYTPCELINILPSIFEIGYQVLDSLMKNLKTDLMPYIKIICEIILHGMKSGKRASSFALHRSSLRILQYN
jgi:hypothetical protein